MTKYGDPEIERVVSFYERGTKPAVISSVLEIPLYRVKAIISASKNHPNTLSKIAEMKKRGMTATDTARALGLSKQYVSRMYGKPRKPFEGDSKVYAVKMDQGEWRKVQQIAEEFALVTKDGTHSGRGSVRMLLEQIARGNLSVVRDRMPM